jgi:hypothetical protein
VNLEKIWVGSKVIGQGRVRSKVKGYRSKVKGQRSRSGQAGSKVKVRFRSGSGQVGVRLSKVLFYMFKLFLTS